MASAPSYNNRSGSTTTGTTKLNVKKKPQTTLTPRPTPIKLGPFNVNTPFDAGGNPITPRPTRTAPPQAPAYQSPTYQSAGSVNPGLPPAAQPPVYASPTGTGYDPGYNSAVPGGSFQAQANAGGTGGTGGAGTTDVTSPLTGLAGNFTPDMLPYVYAQPELILKALMDQQGQAPLTRNSGLFTAGTPYMDALMSILPLAFGGNGQPDTSAPINWLGSQMQQGMTPGGQGIDFGSVINAAKSQLGDPSSAAGQYYNAPGMDPLDQISKMKELMLGAGSASLAPQFQTALKNAMNTASLNYMGKVTTGGTPGNFGNWFLGSDYLNGYR